MGVMVAGWTRPAVLSALAILPCGMRGCALFSERPPTDPPTPNKTKPLNLKITTNLAHRPSHLHRHKGLRCGLGLAPRPLKLLQLLPLFFLDRLVLLHCLRCTQQYSGGTVR